MLCIFHAIKSIKFFESRLVYNLQTWQYFVDNTAICILDCILLVGNGSCSLPWISNGPGPQQNSRDLSLPPPRLMCEISECGVRAHEGATEVPLGKGVEFFIEDVMTNRS